jgi:hypothetical protein
VESYSIKFTVAAGNQNLPASGDLFVYESAVGAGETRLRVKPDNGGEMILRPGQWFRNPDKVTQWAIKSYNGNDVVDAVIVIGFGEFGDANTLNKVTLDATFANKVEVTNTTEKRIPVTLDTAQIITTAGNVMTYTASYSSGVPSGGGAIALLSPGTNVNGVIVNAFDYVGQPPGNFVFTVLAKASPPTGQADGEVIFSGMLAVSVLTSFSMQKAVKVAAGKGVYFYCAQNDNAAVRSALFTVL